MAVVSLTWEDKGVSCRFCMAKLVAEDSTSVVSTGWIVGFRADPSIDICRLADGGGRLIPAGPGARNAALSLERDLVYDYLEAFTRKPPGNFRP